jgi:hypothetical protein
LARIEDCTSASEVTKSITILNTIRWVAEAWGAVPADTIQKCFRNAGVLTRSLEVVRSVTPEESDPFADLDDESEVTEQGDGELNSLIKQLATCSDFCSASDIIRAENDLPVVGSTLKITGKQNSWPP